MRVVVDLGCARYAHASGGMDSSWLLADRFEPEIIYGFDPLSSRDEGSEIETEVMTAPTAAWIWDGLVDFAEDGVASCVVLDGQPLLPTHMRHQPLEPRQVTCFDLAAWLRLLNEKVILKLDVEGAEFLLLTWLLATNAIGYVDLLLVEWHEQTSARRMWRGQLERELETVCPLEEWSY